MKGFPGDPQAPEPTVRLSQPAAGTAGAVWRPLIETMPPSMRSGLGLVWVPGAPGLSQLELVTNRVNVAVFGALGLIEARAHGADLVMFGPALNSHGSWLVHEASPFRHPRDLVGRRVACPPATSETFLQARLAAASTGLDIRREQLPVFGTLAANRAAFERQDVEALIALEPMATELVARGARTIATVAAMWREGTGDAEPLFLAGLAAHRAWVEADRARAGRVAQLVMDANRVLRSNPAQLVALRTALGVPDAVAELLAQRMDGIYVATWDEQVFGSIERQAAAALRLGLVKSKPGKPLYATE